MASPTSTSLFPLEVVRGCKGRNVSVELRNGEFVNGKVVKSDLMMNLVIEKAVRSGTTGDHFWTAREVVVRGTEIVAMQFDPTIITELRAPAHRERGRGRGARPSRGRGSDRGGTSRGRGRGDGGRGRAGGRGRGEGRGRGDGRGRGRGAVKRSREQ